MLRKLAADAPGAAKPLRQLLQTLDDRKRATDNPRRVEALAPPPPDPQSYERSGARGWTGMEALLSYAYWQVLSLNQFDSIGHFLRAVIIEDHDCSPVQNDLRSNEEERHKRDRCASFLGPNQPGITTPDIDNDMHARTPASKPGERRGPGEPEAGPLPGQVDYSKPQPSLPASQQELLETIQGGRPPAAPGADTSSSVNHVLDYLLAP